MPIRLNVLAVPCTVLLLQFTVHAALAQQAASHDAETTAAAPIGTGMVDDDISDRTLQARGARIGLIIVAVDNVFDPRNPQESGTLYRAANALHIKTRGNTIRTQLLFHKGDVYQRHALEESARNLRALAYLSEADIKPVAYHADDNTVDVLVRVHDVWTFNPGISYGRSGGANHSGVQLAESNFLGYGKALSLQTDHDVDRNDAGVSYSDPNLLSSRWQLNTTYIDASDGGTQSLSIAHPFFSLETHWSGAVDGLNEQRIDKRYQMATVVDQYQTTHESYGGQLGWSPGLQDGWVQRWLVGYRTDRLHYNAAPVTGTLQLPADQYLAYPWVGLSWLEDRYETTRNRDQIGRTEDIYYGRALYVQLGISATAFGSDVQSNLLQLTLQDAWHIGSTQSVFASVSANGIHQHDGWRNTLVTTSVRYDYKFSFHTLLTAKFTSDYGIHLDPSLPLYLGDDDGLRGYPLHYISGTHREVLNVEQRYYSNRQLLRLLTIGAVAFVDIGHIGGGSNINETFTDGTHTLSDIGVGLRFGSIRSSTGEVFHINASYPLNAVGTARKLQLQIVTKQSF
jgi:outer membrane protein assembly factor BamA